MDKAGESIFEIKNHILFNKLQLQEQKKIVVEANR